MDANSSAFMSFMGDFIDDLLSLLNNHFILGYSWFSVIIGCMVLTWLLSKLGLHSGKQPKQPKFKKGAFGHFSNERSDFPSDEDIFNSTWG